MEKSVESIELLRVGDYECESRHLVAAVARITLLAIDSVSPKGSNALPQYAQMRVTRKMGHWEAFSNMSLTAIPSRGIEVFHHLRVPCERQQNRSA
jgi:hypothetical protein